MQEAFVIVVIVVGAIGIGGALLTLLTGRRTWDAYGRDRLLLDSDAPASRPATPRADDSPAARDDEVRQMLHARNARRLRRGQEPLDVEAELARLVGGGADATGAEGGAAVDAELRAEIRQLVIARNHRRERRGEPALDVESEVARQISELSG